MKPRKPATNPAKQSGSVVRLSPKLCAHVNAILTERFVKRAGIKVVLQTLETTGVLTSACRLQGFITRVLYVLGQYQASKLGVDLLLLKAIRTRLGIPPQPSSTLKTVARRPRRRFDSRRRGRRIVVTPKVKLSPAPTPARPPREPRPVLTSQLSLGSIIAEAGAVSPPIHNPDNEEGYSKLRRLELIVINKLAHEKVLARTSDLILNYQGMVIHLYSRHEYTPQELQEQYGLTYSEAHSCFLTLD